jgi:hypothetical protein
VVHLGMAPARQVVFEEGGDAMMAIHMRQSGRRHTLVAICERLSAVCGACWRAMAMAPAELRNGGA